MKEKGFTLIELLAVIVILAIIALIATPIILGIINDAREKANERSVELYASAVRNAVAAYQLREGKEVLPDTYNESNPLPFEVEYDGKVECTNVIISEDGKVSLEGCTVNGGEKKYSYGTKKEIGKACTYVDSEDDTESAIGTIDLSDIVTCGTESFYVMFNENNKITMLSKYNLYVGSKLDSNTWESTPIDKPTNKQSELTQAETQIGDIYYGVVAFSSVNYWGQTEIGDDEEQMPISSKYGTGYPAFVYDENADIIYPYVSEYERILKEELGVTSAVATLISLEQLKKLGCSDNSCSDALSWVTASSYWTGSASLPTHLWYVIGGTLSHSFYNNTVGPSLGVRPVITISTSDIQ